MRRATARAALALALSFEANAEPEAPPDARTARIFERVCATCHTRPGIGVPLVGDAEAWRERSARGFDSLLANTVNGIGGMPPLGSCAFCTEQDLRALVDLLAGTAPPAR